MNRRYDVLLCDADNTIFDFQQAEMHAFAQACAFAGMQATDALLAVYARINDALWRLLEQGGITQEALRVRRFEQLLAHIGREDVDAQAVSEHYVEALSHQSIPMNGAVEAVERWSSILPVIVVTNGISRVQHGRFDGSALAPYLSGLLISEEVGAFKPDPRMLLMGMERAGVTERSRALMLGDSLSSDIAAAARAGIDACWLNSHGKTNASGLPVAYTIRSLDEVEDILLGKREKEA